MDNKPIADKIGLRETLKQAAGACMQFKYALNNAEHDHAMLGRIGLSAQDALLSTGSELRMWMRELDRAGFCCFDQATAKQKLQEWQESIEEGGDGTY